MKLWVTRGSHENCSFVTVWLGRKPKRVKTLTSYQWEGVGPYTICCAEFKKIFGLELERGEIRRVIFTGAFV